MTVLLILAVVALASACVAAAGKCPLWVPVVFLSLYALIQQLPVGK